MSRGRLEIVVEYDDDAWAWSVSRVRYSPRHDDDYDEVLASGREATEEEAHQAADEAECEIINGSTAEDYRETERDLRRWVRSGCP